MLGLRVLSERQLRVGFGGYIYHWDEVQAVLGLGFLSEMQVMVELSLHIHHQDNVKALLV